MRVLTALFGFVATMGMTLTLATPTSADGSPPPPTFAVASGTITVTAGTGTHINSQFPWSFKDNLGNKVTTVVFTFPPDPAATATVTKTPAAGTLRGGYCQETGCYTFKAACTTSACTITSN